jgi:hypothetical protein
LTLFVRLSILRSPELGVLIKALASEKQTSTTQGGKMNRRLWNRVFPALLMLAAFCFGSLALPGLAVAQEKIAEPFTVPAWMSLRIRLDDTLTSKYSEVGDPFSATVLDPGTYQSARVYGHISEIDQSGKFRGHTTMILSFDRLQMPDGRRAKINAEIVQLYHAPSGESVDVEGAIESTGRGKKTFEHTAIGAGAGALLGAIFGGGKGAGLGSIFGGATGLGTTAFSGPQDIVLQRGQEMLIRITGPSR